MPEAKRRRRRQPADRIVRFAWIFFGLTLTVTVGALVALTIAPPSPAVRTQPRSTRAPPPPSPSPSPPKRDDAIVTDLDAQIAMARAAEAMLELAYWQLGLGALGTLFLIITLRESRRSANAAVQAISHQRQIEQAIIEVADFSFKMCSGDSFESFAKNRYNLECSFNTIVTNLGQTAAKLESYRLSLAILDGAGEVMLNRDLEGKITNAGRVAAHKETPLSAINWFHVSEAVYARLSEGFRAEIRLILTYKDVFTQHRRDEFSYMVEAAALETDWHCARVDPSDLKPVYGPIPLTS